MKTLLLTLILILALPHTAGACEWEIGVQRTHTGKIEYYKPVEGRKLKVLQTKEWQCVAIHPTDVKIKRLSVAFDDRTEVKCTSSDAAYWVEVFGSKTGNYVRSGSMTLGRGKDYKTVYNIWIDCREPRPTKANKTK